MRSSRQCATGTHALSAGATAGISLSEKQSQPPKVNPLQLYYLLPPNRTDHLMVRGCDWVRDYLKTNPNVTESDKHLCDGIGTERR